jgi:alpha-ketoglutarate-dependent taurine dioxygenase
MRFAELMAGLPAHKQALARRGLITLRDVEPVTDPELVAFAEAFSDAPSEKLLAWDFGTVMRMRYDPEAANYLFSAERVPLHWDGAFHREPRYLLFFCDSSEGEGGETEFVDTVALLGALPEARIARWQGVTLTYSTEKKAHYGGRFSTSLVRPHPVHGRQTLRFAEAVETERNPVHLEISGSDDPGLYRELEALVRDPRFTYRHGWRPGDVVVVDNHSFLHGRAPLGANTGRSFRRVQIL